MWSGVDEVGVGYQGGGQSEDWAVEGGDEDLRVVDYGVGDVEVCMEGADDLALGVFCFVGVVVEEGAELCAAVIEVRLGLGVLDGLRGLRGEVASCAGENGDEDIVSLVDAFEMLD